MKDGGIQIRVSDMLFAIRKRWKLIALLTVIGLLLGIMLTGVSYLQGTMSKNYEIDAAVAVLTQKANGLFTSGNESPNLDDTRMANEFTDSVVYIVNSLGVIDAAIDDLALIGVTNRDISDNLTVSRVEETQIIELSLTWRSAEEGVAILNAILVNAREALLDTLHIGNLAEVNPPYTRYLVGGGLNAPLWGYMLVIGFVAGIGIVILELLMRPTLINLGDVEPALGLETLGVIPSNTGYFRKKKSLLASDGITAPEITQNYSAAAYILRNRLGSKNTHQCFYVTSSISGEGKTTVAANLAIQLSDMEQRVLLIDFNTRNPSLGGLFLEHVDYNYSFNALYKGEAIEEEAITTLTGYLDLLPMIMDGTAIPMDSEVIELVRRLTQKYNYVIIDAPAVGVVSDALSLNQIASTVLFVIRYDSATIREIQEALDKLQKSGIRVLGCIVNAAMSLSDASAAQTVRPSERRRSAREKSLSPGEMAELKKEARQQEKDLGRGGKKTDSKKGARSLFKKSKKRNPASDEPSEKKEGGADAEKKEDGANSQKETPKEAEPKEPKAEPVSPASAPEAEKGQEEAPKAASPAEKLRPRSVFEEIDQQPEGSLSDSEAADALYRLALEGEKKGGQDE